jgi:ABC-2 type transport system permease protein
MNQDIRGGALARRLLKPIHPLIAYSAENLSALPLRAALSLPITVLTLVMAEPGSLPRTPSALAALAAALLGAWLINFLTMAMVGTLAFFLESSTAVYEIWLAAFMLLSGYMVPLELFPPWLRDASAVLPFRYTLAFPVEVLTGMIQGRALVHDLVVQWAYVAGSAAAALLGWRVGIRRYAAYGG